MNDNEKIYEYEYLDEIYEKLRDDKLRNYLTNNEIIDFNFFDLQMYKQNKDNKEKALDILNKSILDPSIVLTSQQLEILSILETDSIFVSAPTSFGKTFIALEFIKRHIDTLNNIIFIVPTLALMNELLKKIFNNFYDNYNICINSFEEIKEKNIFIFVPERSDTAFFDKIKDIEIDLLIFDEIYKLKAENINDITHDDRLIIMNKVYLMQLQKAKKIVLLGPFIKKINFDQTKIDIVRYYSNFMPVCNVISKMEPDEWINHIGKVKTLVYFRKPENIYHKVKDIIETIKPNEELCEKYKVEIEYLEKEVSRKWYVIELLKRGIGIHHGKTPMFLRKFYETEYNSGAISTLLCTSTLMEGINTPTNTLFIVSNPDNPFQLNNLIGRVGRLNPAKPIIGNVYICNDDAYKMYINKEKWIDLTILAESKKVFTNDEILFLDKKPQDENQKKDFENKLASLEKSGIQSSDIKKYDVCFDKVYIFAEENYKKKFETIKNLHDCINTAIKLIGTRGYDFKTNDFKNLSFKYENQDHLPYKYYISDILHGKDLGEMIYYFNEQYNLTNDINNINLFIDKIFILKKYIKFTLSKILNYFELFNISNENAELNQFISLLKKFSNYTGHDKIFEDLGIEEHDFPAISKYIPKTEFNSTSSIIKVIKSKKNNIINERISPFTKHNIKNL